MTLQALLSKTVLVELKDGTVVPINPQFRVSVQRVDEAGVHFIIHPDGFSGETLDFICVGNELKAFASNCKVSK